MQQALHARKNGCDIVGGAPSVLENVETQLAVCIDIGVEHAREKLDRGRLVGVLLVECQDQLECPILKRCVG